MTLSFSPLVRENEEVYTFYGAKIIRKKKEIEHVAHSDSATSVLWLDPSASLYETLTE